MKTLVRIIKVAALCGACYAVGKAVGTCYGAGLVMVAYKTRPIEAKAATDHALNDMKVLMPKTFNTLMKDFPGLDAQDAAPNQPED